MPGDATDKTDVVATDRKFVDSFNKGDMKALTATAPIKPQSSTNFLPTTGSMLTIALQKSGGAWRMTGWAWARH